MAFRDIAAGGRAPYQIFSHDIRRVRQRARIGETAWTTSLFPDKDSGSYLLPVKAEVRKKEGLAVGDEVTVSLVFDADI